MQIPAQVDFQGFEPTGRQRTLIEERMADLDKFFDRIMACHVVMKGPGQHQRTGGQYQVNIHLVLPGGHEATVDRTPPENERFSDASFAINDSFNRARRQLQDAIRHMQGEVKMHEPQPIGTVRQMNTEEGYGVLESPDGREIYFHRNSVLGDAFGQLKPGTRVNFSEESGDKGPQASSVRLLGKHGLR
ncbi:cold shock domain-containing protein [Microvirga mediterraneensis]|uniref:HPF/RaiA family ribosome-associated protein n=1 Tax=Microvirga mediterraneensis TaxID=2754695 RepID=A0A838BSL6_9HYPH|nr:cold shock domain-containing protein [Microvirga mediterraneensis]MBA1158804.1 HPF/RaiA family ribosome-associated protein [Microvirga mediterraneensis]